MRAKLLHDKSCEAAEDYGYGKYDFCAPISMSLLRLWNSNQTFKSNTRYKTRRRQRAVKHGAKQKTIPAIGLRQGDPNREKAHVGSVHDHGRPPSPTPTPTSPTPGFVPYSGCASALQIRCDREVVTPVRLHAAPVGRSCAET